MTDPCDNCTNHYCYKCEHAESEEAEDHIIQEHKEYLANHIHKAEQIIHWLSYQPEMSDCEKYQLERMTAFLESLRKRIE